MAILHRGSFGDEPMAILGYPIFWHTEKSITNWPLSIGDDMGLYYLLLDYWECSMNKVVILN